MLGLAIGTLLIWREKEQTRAALARAEDEREQADVQRRRAEKNFRKSIEGVTLLLQHLQNPNAVRPGQLQSFRRALCDEARQFYEGFLAEKSADPGMRWELGVASVHLGIIYGMLEEHAEAVAIHRRAIAIFDQLADDFPKIPRYRSALASIHGHLGLLLERAGRAKEAEEAYQKALTLQQQLADRLLVTKGNVVGLLNRMERDGLVTRQPHPEDGRAHLVSLTEQGATLAAQVIPEHEALVAEYLGVLTPENRGSLHEVLRRLNHALGPE